MQAVAPAELLRRQRAQPGEFARQRGAIGAAGDLHPVAARVSGLGRALRVVARGSAGRFWAVRTGSVRRGGGAAGAGAAGALALPAAADSPARRCRPAPSSAPCAAGAGWGAGGWSAKPGAAARSERRPDRGRIGRLNRRLGATDYRDGDGSDRIGTGADAVPEGGGRRLGRSGTPEESSPAGPWRWKRSGSARTAAERPAATAERRCAIGLRRDGRRRCDSGVCAMRITGDCRRLRSRRACATWRPASWPASCPAPAGADLGRRYWMASAVASAMVRLGLPCGCAAGACG